MASIAVFGAVAGIGAALAMMSSARTPSYAPSPTKYVEKFGLSALVTGKYVEKSGKYFAELMITAPVT